MTDLNEIIKNLEKGDFESPYGIACNQYIWDNLEEEWRVIFW